MNNQHRVYGQKINVDREKIRDFFDKRAIAFNLNTKSRNTTVLLGDGDSSYADNWNVYEKKMVLPVLDIQRTDSVLDIGCGLGRWAESLIPLCSYYTGADISSEMIKMAEQVYGERYKNVVFLNVSFQELFDRAEIKGRQFDKIIIAGVSMYLNDSDLENCFVRLNDILSNNGIIYIEESIGRKERLTLNNIWSENLKANYWAVYRTVEEYLDLLQPLTKNSEILQNGYFNNLDKEEMQDTGHWHIILRKY